MPLQREYPLGVAMVYAGLGDTGRAFKWLEIAYQQHAPDMVKVKRDPRLRSLRADHRFQDLLRRMGYK